MVNVMFALFMLMFVITAMDVKKIHHRRHGATGTASPGAVAAVPGKDAGRELPVRRPVTPPPEMKPKVDVKAEADVKPEAVVKIEAGVEVEAEIKTDAGAGVETRPASRPPSGFWESTAAAPETGDMTDVEPAARGTGIDIQPLSVDEDAPTHP